VLSGEEFGAAHTASFLYPVIRFLLPAAPTTTVDAIHRAIRKLAHLTEYAVLALLVWRALSVPGQRARRAALLTLTICFAYAVLDETHQVLVPGRTGSPIDVAIDTLGAALGLCIRSSVGLDVSAGRRSPA